MHWKSKGMAERVGFEASNVEPCTGLHGLAQAQKQRRLWEFPLSTDFVDVFCSQFAHMM